MPKIMRYYLLQLILFSIAFSFICVLLVSGILLRPCAAHWIIAPLMVMPMAFLLGITVKEIIDILHK